MRLDAILEVVNNLANGYRKNNACQSRLCLAKDEKSSKYYLIVNNCKKPTNDKFRLAGNVEKIYCKFANEGKATIVLKEPNFSLILQKANASQLKTFLKMVHLAASSQNLSGELDKIQKENEMEMETSNSKVKVANSTNQQLKKAITTLTIKSKAEYQTNFRSIISQNLKVKTAFGNYSNIASTLTRLAINNCELTNVNSSIFELYQLTHLDLSANKLSKLDNFALKRLEELNLTQNEIKTIGRNIQLPKLISLDLSFNKLYVIDRHFCANFKSLARLRLNNNEIVCFSAKFGYSLSSLQMLNASCNKLVNMPYSLSHLRLEMLELNDNPFETSLPNSQTLNSTLKTFPRLVELCARQIINRKVKYSQKDIPNTLYEYIDTNIKCICGRACYEYNIKLPVLYDLNRMAKSFTYLSVNGKTDNQVSLMMSFCSLRCYKNNCRLKTIW